MFQKPTLDYHKEAFQHKVNAISGIVLKAIKGISSQDINVLKLLLYDYFYATNCDTRCRRGSVCARETSYKNTGGILICMKFLV